MAESSSSSIAQEDTLDETDVPGAPKKVKRDCRFKQEWRSHGMLPSKKGPTFAYCKTCNADINIASQSLQRQRLTNGLQAGNIECSLFYVQNKYITTWYINID